MKLKFYYNRIRPYQLANIYKFPLNPMPTVSAQSPSYPSGHTVQSKVFAEILSFRYPDQQDMLTKFADKCSKSRIILGVHFPSDEVFGKQLAQGIINDDNFKNKYFNASKIAKSIGDSKSPIKNYVNNNTKNLITRRINPKNPNDIFAASLHFICLDKENLINVKNHITLGRYLKSKEVVAEGHAIIWSKEFNIPIDNEGYIIDTINNMNNFDMINRHAPNFFWNYSIDDNYKIFFSKKDNEKSLKFIIWDIKKEIVINWNDDKFNETPIEEWVVYKIKNFHNEARNLVINGKDYTSIYQNIHRNYIDSK